MGRLSFVEDDGREKPTIPDVSQPVFAAERILQGHRSAKIVLGDQVYLLRLTRAGKLILTK